MPKYTEHFISQIAYLLILQTMFDMQHFNEVGYVPRLGLYTLVSNPFATFDYYYFLQKLHLQ